MEKLRHLGEVPAAIWVGSVGESHARKDVTGGGGGSECPHGRSWKESRALRRKPFWARWMGSKGVKGKGGKEGGKNGVSSRQDMHPQMISFVPGGDWRKVIWSRLVLIIMLIVDLSVES